jgi:hypothetical protein
MSGFSNSKRVMESESGHKEFFDGRSAACLSCASRFDINDFPIHISEDHNIVDIIEGFIEASFYIDDLEMKKSLRYKK